MQCTGISPSEGNFEKIPLAVVLSMHCWAGRLIFVIIQRGDVMTWIRVVMAEVERSGCVLVLIRQQTDRIYWWDQLCIRKREVSGMTPRFLAYNQDNGVEVYWWVRCGVSDHVFVMTSQVRVACQTFKWRMNRKLHMPIQCLVYQGFWGMSGIYKGIYTREGLSCWNSWRQTHWIWRLGNNLSYFERLGKSWLCSLI